MKEKKAITLADLEAQAEFMRISHLPADIPDLDRILAELDRPRGNTDTAGSRATARFRTAE